MVKPFKERNMPPPPFIQTRLALKPRSLQTAHYHDRATYPSRTHPKGRRDSWNYVPTSTPTQWLMFFDGFDRPRSIKLKFLTKPPADCRGNGARFRARHVHRGSCPRKLSTGSSDGGLFSSNGANSVDRTRTIGEHFGYTRVCMGSRPRNVDKRA